MVWRFFEELFGPYKGRILGALVGLVLSLLIINYGILRTVFIATVIVLGYYLGLRWEETGGFEGLFRPARRRD